MQPSLRGAASTVADVMRRQFVSVSPDESLPGARQTMRLARLRHLVVAQEERLVGLLSYRAVLEALLDDLGEKTVRAAMVPSPTTLGPATPLTVAAERLCRYGFGCLPVVEPDCDRVIGLITETDLLRVAFRRNA